MTFSRPIDVSDPPGTQRADTIARELRELRQDILERFTALLGMDPSAETEVFKFARLLMTGAAASKIIGGSTSTAFRNNVDDANNVVIEDDGDVTLRKDLTILGKIIAALVIDHNVTVEDGHTVTFQSPVTLSGAQGSITPRDLGNIVTAQTIDWSLGNNVKATLIGSVTLTFTNPAAGAIYLFEVKQGGGGGSLITWPVSVIWPDGIAPTITPTAGKTDIITFYYNGTSYIGAAFTQNVNV